MRRRIGWIGLLALMLLGGYAAAQVKYVGTEMQNSAGIKTPLKVGTNYTLSNPTVAPTPSSSATSGSFLTSRTYRFYVAWANLSGRTNLSPVSVDCVGGSACLPVTLRRVTVTRNETVPSGALGWIVYWSSSFDSHVVKHLCGSGGYDGQLVASGTSTYACQGSTSGDIPHDGTNNTGMRAKIDLDVVSGTIRSGAVGSTIGSAVEGSHSLDLTGSTLKYDGTTVGQAIRVISICSSGCQYTTLDSACSTETSTSALPILYVVGPGTYGQTSCSGEDHATFWGAGPGVTTLSATGVTGENGTFKPGTSTNWTMAGFTLHGHRGIFADMATTGGGAIRVRDIEFTNEAAQADEDCAFFERAVAGSRLFFEDNRCIATVDGLTISRDASNLEVYSRGNIFLNAATSTGSSRPFRFNSDPCMFVSAGDTINFVQGRSTAYEIEGYYFTGEVAGDCSGTSRVFINNSTAFIRNTSTNQTGSGVAFILALSASGIDELHIAGTSAVVQASDIDDTTVQGIGILQTSGLATTVVGSEISASGGINNYALQSDGAPISVWSTKCDAEIGHTSGRITGQHCGPLTDAPSVCNIGDTYTDTSPAICVCSAANTWTKTAGAGACV